MASIVVTILFVAALPLSFLRPWIGVLIFLFVCFTTPQRYVGGLAEALPFARLIAVAILAGMARSREWFPPPRTRELYLFAALGVVFVLSTTLVATHPERAWDLLMRTMKILVMACVTLALFNDRRRVRLLLLVIALSIGLYGAGGGLWVLWTGGQQELYGPPGTFLSENNFLGFALVTVLPLFVFLRRCETSPWLRNLLLAVFALSIIAVLGTYSRGSLINLTVVLGCLLLAVRTKDLAVLAVIVATPVIVWLAPPRYHARIETVAAPQEQRSVRMRSKSLYVALRLGLDNPILGAGFQPFDEAVYERYLPGYRDNHNAHNHFLQIFAEHGFPGIGLFVALIVSMFSRLIRTMQRSRGDPSASDIYHYANGLLICCVGYVVGGMFINQPYFEPFYQLAAAAVIVSGFAPHGEHQTSSANRSQQPHPAAE